MKKFLLLLTFSSLPLFSVSQTTFANWTLNNNTAPSGLTHVTASNFTIGGVSSTVNANGAALTNWPTNATYDNNKFFEVSVTANAGKYLNVNEINFKYINNSNTTGVNKGTIKYVIVNPGESTPDNTNFWNNGIIAAGGNNFAITRTTNEVIFQLNALGILLQPSQKLIVRFYANGASANTNVFNVRANSLNLKGVEESFSTNSWTGYVYNWAGGKTTNHLGTVTESIIFDRNMGTGNVTGATTALTATPANNFFIRYKMKTTTTGQFNITVGGDDGYRLSLDDGATWIINNFTDHSYTSTTKQVCLTGPTNFVLEYYENAGDARVNFSYSEVSTPAPTSITGTTLICIGNSTTLTANGVSTNNTTSFFQWGTGAVGSNIISNQTGSAITVSPTATTSYWVRVKDISCTTTFSTGITNTVNVVSNATAPTGISGNTGLYCPSSSITLTANGGSGDTYQWGTGTTVGSNIIPGATAISYVANPSVTTTYWVRRFNTPCTTNGYTSGVTTTVNVGVVGDQTSFGTDKWIGYVYTYTGNTPATTNYIGRVEESEIFNRNMASGVVDGTNPQLCSTPTDKFFIRYKMTKNFTAGSYTITVGADDGYRFSIDGGSSWLPELSNYSDHSYSSKSAAVCLSGATDLVIEYYENTGEARVSFNYTLNTPAPVTPTNLTGNTSICAGSTTTLTANGTSGTFEWGTGTVGTNIIGGQTASTLSTNAINTTTTYWVRTVAGVCRSDAKTLVVNITPQAINPTTITGTTSICSGSSTTLTADGTSGTFEWGTGTTVGTNPIAGATTNTLTVSPTANTTYWVRVKATSPCTVASDGRTATVTVANPATAPTTISGNNNHCSTTEITLTASGGTGNVYQWGTGTSIGQNIIGGSAASTASISINPTTTTTYWVRRGNPTPCSGYTDGVFKTVSVGAQGDPTAFGINEWNVYGYENTTLLNPTNYKGYYVQNLGSNFGFDSKLKWAEATTPSGAPDWQGCPITGSNYTFIHKREGFPCGRYQLAFLYYDEDTVVTVKDATGTIFTQTYTGFYNGGTNQSQAINGTNTFALDAKSTIEIRTRNTSGPGKAGLKMTSAGTATYANGTWDKNASYSAVQVNDNINITSDLMVCSCAVQTGKTVTVAEGTALVVLENINVAADGQIIVENNASLVQVNDNATYTGAETSFTAKRETQKVFRYDFTYWSSPVKNFVLKSVSPITLFDKFFSWNHTNQSWLMHKSNLPVESLERMTPGKGYSVRAPQSYSIEGSAGAIAKKHLAQFIGIPNNGVVQVPVSNGAAEQWNLVGNPYPSAVAIAAFLQANQNVVEGTLYFWSHKTAAAPSSPENNYYYTYSATDYVAVNLSGSVANGVVESAPDDNSLGVVQNSEFPNIASGQSFFIKGKATGFTGNQVIFNNAMRVKEGGKNSQFFKPGVTTPVEDWELTGKHRMWLNLTTQQNDFNQILVGYIENATNDLDWGYDGELFSSGAATLYSLLDEKALTIQARALPFNTIDEVPLGYKTTRTGTMTITIDHVDGLFEGQAIYLEDKVLNVIHNLKETNYTFTTIPGTFDNRFVLRYLPQEELGTQNPTIDANSIVIFNTNNQISVKSNNETISEITIYDLQGRLLFTKKNVNASEFTTQSLSAVNQVVLVKVITDRKAEVVKKVILK